MTGEICRLLFIVCLAGIYHVTTASRTGSSSRNDFLDWLKTHSNNENALLEHARPHDVTSGNREVALRRSLITELIPILIKELEQYRYALEVEEEEASDDNEASVGTGDKRLRALSAIQKRFYGKRNFQWQPMGGPLPVETRLVAFGSKLGPGSGGEGGSSNKAMRYGR